MRTSFLGVFSLALLFATAACSGSERGSTGAVGRSRTKGAQAFPSPPTVDGSRKPCLDAPYTPGIGATAFSDGSAVHSTPAGRSWRFEIPGASEIGPVEATSLVMRARARGGEFTFLSYGIYCENRACFSLEINLCEGSVEDLARKLKTLLGEERGPAAPRLDVVISLSGELGPRDCGGADCDPIPYDGTPYYDRDQGRKAGALPDYSSGACSRDADCMVKGCGNHCVSWEQGGAHQAATCEGYSMPSTFCGCVERECGWFTQ